MNPGRDFAKRLGACVALLAGVATLAFVGLDLFKIVRARSLETAAGTVQSVHIDAPPEGDPARKAFWPVIEYAYRVNGADYANDVYALFFTAHTLTDAEQIAARYAPGGACTVHYDPNRPQTSFLSVNVDQGRFLYLGLFSFLGVFWLLGGMAILRTGRLFPAPPAEPEEEAAAP